MLTMTVQGLLQDIIGYDDTTVGSPHLLLLCVITAPITMSKYNPSTVDYRPTIGNNE